MITPITFLGIDQKQNLLIFKLLGNRIILEQDKHGDWTIMKTVQWPLVAVFAIVFMYYSCFLLFSWDFLTIMCKFLKRIKVNFHHCRSDFYDQTSI